MGAGEGGLEGRPEIAQSWTVGFQWPVVGLGNARGLWEPQEGFSRGQGLAGFFSGKEGNGSGSCGSRSQGLREQLGPQTTCTVAPVWDEGS